VAGYGLSNFMSKIGAKDGMSLTTNFDIEFDFLKYAPKDTKNQGARKVPDFADDGIVKMLCDEAQLPNVQSAVAQRSGRYLGEGPVSYPHTRIFTDLSLGFLMDAQMMPLKFFNSWYNHIFGEQERTFDGSLAGAKAVQPFDANRTNRLKYLDEYACCLKIMKTEPDSASPNGRCPVVYLLEKCYPYSIDTVPLAYGSSQIARLTVNFYYSRHTVAYGNQIRNPEYKSSPIGTGMTLRDGTIEPSR